MTYVPPPPPGDYPPPPPGNYPPPPPGGYPAYPAATPVGNLPPQAYASWIVRVVALLIDVLPAVLIAGVGAGVLLATADTVCVGFDDGAACTSTASAFGVLVSVALHLAAFAYQLWNRGYRQGTTGKSIGKSVMKIKLVSEASGQPIGFGMSFVRDIAHLVDAVICYVGFLFPLWDAKRQTLADKMISTVVLPTV